MTDESEPISGHILKHRDYMRMQAQDYLMSSSRELLRDIGDALDIEDIPRSIINADGSTKILTTAARVQILCNRARATRDVYYYARRHINAMLSVMPNEFLKRAVTEANRLFSGSTRKGS